MTNTPTRFLMFMLTLLLLCSSVKAQNLLQNIYNDSGYKEGEIIVMLNPGVTPERFMNSYAVRNGSSVNMRVKEPIVDFMNIWLLEYDVQRSSAPDALLSVMRLPDVKMAQFNHYVSQRATPNDARFGEMWDMNNTGQTVGGVVGTVDADIDAPEAWNLTTGGITAAGDTIVVAVVDGGFRLTHDDLNFWRNYGEIAGNGIDDDANGYIDDVNGWNAYNNNGTITSDNHGTHVAGTVGARGNNSVGVTGVNWNVKVMAVQGSSGQEATVITAYGYILKQRRLYRQTNGVKGAFVVATNASFGVDFGQASSYPLWCAMYDSLGSEGILNAGAGPNSNTNIDTQGDIPTTCPSDFMVAVTNTTNRDVKTTSAGYGPINMDIGAPGTNILSTTSTSNTSYGLLSGTSMATPHVAGAIGLMYAAGSSAFINFAKNDPDSCAKIIKQYLLSSVDTLASLQTLVLSKGRLNLFKAVTKVINSPLPVELSAFTYNVSKNNVKLNWSTSQEINNKDFTIQRKAVDGSEWVDLGSVKGNGTTNTGQAYSYEDKKLSSGRYNYRLKQNDYNGNFEYHNLTSEVIIGIPLQYALSQNYPNPFNPSTKIDFTLPAETRVTLKVYDMLGREISVLFNNELKNAGYYTVNFNASAFTSGVYFYKIQTSDFTQVKKMMLMK